MTLQISKLQLAHLMRQRFNCSYFLTLIMFSEQQWSLDDVLLMHGLLNKTESLQPLDQRDNSIWLFILIYIYIISDKTFSGKTPCEIESDGLQFIVWSYSHHGHQLREYSHD